MSPGEDEAALETDLAEANSEMNWEVAQTAVDAAGVIDPTPVSDLVGGGMSLSKGDLLGAGLSLISIVPYLGDALAKSAKGARAIARIKKLGTRIAEATKKLTALRRSKTGAKAVSAADDAIAKAAKAGKAEPPVCVACQKAPRSLAPKPKGVPDNWVAKPSKKGGGTRYVDPANPHNSVRTMPGDPKSPHPNSQRPYVRHTKNGQSLDVNGNVVPKNSPAAHIPADQFNFK